MSSHYGKRLLGCNAANVFLLLVVNVIAISSSRVSSSSTGKGKRSTTCYPTYQDKIRESLPE